MGIKLRLSRDVRLVSRYDTAIVGAKKGCLGKYLRSLNIDELGDLRGFKHLPSVFTVRPLTVDYEYMVNGENSNWWGIFSSHVKEITGLPKEIKLESEDGILDDKLRELFPPRTVRDIAQMVIDLANEGEDSIFFTVPADYSDWLLRAKTRLVNEEQEAGVRLAAAIAKSQKSEASQSTTTEPSKSSE